jgi:hypothetical protein
MEAVAPIIDMNEVGAQLRRSGERLLRQWVDALYVSEQIKHPFRLSFEQLVEPVQDFFDVLGRLIEEEADLSRLEEEVRQLRNYGQVRFRQGVLIDEMARELMCLRRVVNDFLWRETTPNSTEAIPALRAALQRANRFFDEIMAQTLITYAASFRPPIETRSSVWPPPRRRKTDFPDDGHN